MSPVNRAARDAVTDPGLHTTVAGLCRRPSRHSKCVWLSTDYLTPWSRSVPCHKVLTGLVLLWGEGSGGRALVCWPGRLCLLNSVGYPSVGI